MLMKLKCYKYPSLEEMEEVVKLELVVASCEKQMQRPTEPLRSLRICPVHVFVKHKARIVPADAPLTTRYANVAQLHEDRSCILWSSSAR